MVFRSPVRFPKSIYENVAYGLRLQGVKKRRVLDEAVGGPSSGRRARGARVAVAH